MAGYQVAMIGWPEDWEPESLDDVSPQPGEILELLPEADDLFAAVQQAVEHNRRSRAESGDRWAVVVEADSPGKTWPTARLCTPIAYHVMGIWWPDGWEPDSPLDLPNCISCAHGPQSGRRLTYQQAAAAVHGLNRQCMDQPGATWYVVAAVENESVSRTVTYDPPGTETTVEVRRLHVLRPESGGRGDCSCCPAHDFPCARELKGRSSLVFHQ
ncbi:MAG: hypothetical protein JXB62_03265 [Pirellulales bacterium]|nr:hypothetical protein [Pirellulales bacterium]